MLISITEEADSAQSMAQNEWCQKMGIRLVRVTDTEYSTRDVAAIVDKIER